jgi:DNA-binding NtrC family response regulator
MLAIPTILITDDDAALRTSLGEALARRGFRVSLAEDGEQGLQIASSGKIHLALIDYQMPRLGGLEMLAKLREMSPDVPSILMSAALDDAVRAEAMRMKVYGLMNKPLRLREIDGVVRDCLADVYGWAG